MVKKYLFGSLAALTVACCTISCGDEDVYDPSMNTDVLKYEAAFMKAFNVSSIPANQTWGFGTSYAARGTRAISATPDLETGNIPSKPTSTDFVASNFPATTDADFYGDVNGGGGYASGTSYINSTIKNVNIWGNGGWNDGILYVSGNCTSFDSFYAANGTTFVLLKDAKLTISGPIQPGCKVFVGEGAELTINGNSPNPNVSYYVKGGTITVNGDVYVGGGADFFIENGDFNVTGNLEIQSKNANDDVTNFCATNADINIGGNLTLSPEAPATVYYQESGTLVCGGDLNVNSSYFYSAVNTDFASILATGSGKIINLAEMNSKSTIIMSNGESLLINYGELTGKYLRTEGSGDFLNASGATTTISGYTVIDSNGNGWVNEGTYNTVDFQYCAGSVNVFNNCRMNVSNKFYFDLGDTNTNSFQMNGDASVVTKYFEGTGPFIVRLGSNSVFKVTDTATMNATKAGYGFFGEGDDYAVIDAKNIVKGAEGQGFEVTYGGKLYVYASDFHFAQGNDGAENHPFIAFEDDCSIANIYAPGDDFKDGKPSITIAGSETGCNIGFQGDEKKYTIRIMGEDLSTTDDTNDVEKLKADFDFNDVVFDVMWLDNGDAQIRLCAAGGTLPLYVGNDGTNEEYEIHHRFAVANPGKSISTKTVINATNKNEFTKPVFTLTGPFKNADGDNDASLIPVYVKKNNQTVQLTAIRGKVASKIGVDPKVMWPDEKQCIDKPYPKFEQWVKMEVEKFY